MCRTPHVLFDGAPCDSVPASSGVLHGTVLAPFLFLLHIYNLLSTPTLPLEFLLMTVSACQYWRQMQTPPTCIYAHGKSLGKWLLDHISENDSSSLDHIHQYNTLKLYTINCWHPQHPSNTSEYTSHEILPLTHTLTLSQTKQTEHWGS